MTQTLRARMRAALVALLLCLAIVEIAAAEDTIDPPGRVARLSYTEGEVSVAPAGTNDWAQAVLNRPLTSGDRLLVEPGARAELQLDSALIHLDAATHFSFLELDDESLLMSLSEGTATLHVRRRGAEERVQVETPNGAISLLHPGEYTIEVDPDADMTVVKVRNGDAEVRAGNDSHGIRKGDVLEVRGADGATVVRRRLEERTDFERWANARNREREDAVSSRYVASEVIGHEDLDRHGEWIYDREYGHIWRPYYVAVNWAPYRYGRWIWISPWGFTWIDDAPWGFAPFHYGRWVSIHHHWHWVPGPRHVRPIYAPALVAWTGSGTRVGWFPLGPRDIYIPQYRHSPRYIRHVNESNSRWLSHRDLRGLDRRHGSFDYRFARYPPAITIVDRDRFLAGRPLGDAHMNLGDRDLHQWRAQPRPPALTPYRESVLGGEARTIARPLRDADRHRDGFPRYRMPARIPFETERHTIEANRGQPPSRVQLFDRAWRNDRRDHEWQTQTRSPRTLTTAESAGASPRAVPELGSIRRPPEIAARGWRTRPDAAIDSVARDREIHARERAERGRHADSSGNRLPGHAWRSQSDTLRERMQRDRPRRMPDTPRATPSPQTQRMDVPRARGNDGRGSQPHMSAPTRSMPSGPQMQPRMHER